MSDEKLIETTIAFTELKGNIVKLMFEFTDKWCTRENEMYAAVPRVLVDVLTSCLSEAQYHTVNYAPFTPWQRDHICFQIGNWYLMMKPLLEGQHNLGYMKEKLKTMICGE